MSSFTARVAALHTGALAMLLAGASGMAPRRASLGGHHHVIQAGRIEERTVHSARYDRDRRVWIYTPAGYARTGHAPYDLLVVFDGDVYQRDIPLPVILDTLGARGAIPPFVAVLIDDSEDRLGDLANHARFADFLAGDVIPIVRKGYNVTTDPRRTIVTGSSAGGLAAAYVAFRHPEVFGNVLSQSGAFWRGNEGSNAPPFEWLTRQYEASPARDIRMLLDVGELETRPALGVGPSIRDANRRLRDVLVAKGYTVWYTEVAGGNHAPEYWRKRLPDALVRVTAGWKR